MAFKIYTKTGDKGSTSLIGGTKVAKSHLRIESYGNLDELNSYVGLVNDLISDQASKDMMREVQDRLFTIGSSLACDPEKDTGMQIPDLHDEDVAVLEKEIDRMNEVLPDMRSFVLPGGSVAVSTIHIARCICRRTERGCVRLQEENMFVEPLVIQYLNRLSDYLFVLSRYIAMQQGVAEIPWRPRV